MCDNSTAEITYRTLRTIQRDTRQMGLHMVLLDVSENFLDRIKLALKEVRKEWGIFREGCRQHRIENGSINKIKSQLINLIQIVSEMIVSFEGKQKTKKGHAYVQEYYDEVRAEIEAVTDATT